MLALVTTVPEGWGTRCHPHDCIQVVPARGMDTNNHHRSAYRGTDAATQRPAHRDVMRQIPLENCDHAGVDLDAPNGMLSSTCFLDQHVYCTHDADFDMWPRRRPCQQRHLLPRLLGRCR